MSEFHQNSVSFITAGDSFCPLLLFWSLKILFLSSGVIKSALMVVGSLSPNANDDTKETNIVKRAPNIVYLDDHKY